MELAIPRIDIGLVTPQIEVARDFYAEVFGFEATEPIVRRAGVETLRVRAGEQYLELHQPSRALARQPSGIDAGLGYRVIAIFVDDLAAVADRIRERGRRITEPTTIVGSLQVAFAKDADGNFLELIGLPEPQGDALADRLQVGLTVADVARSRHFHGEILGLEEHPCVPMADGRTRYAFSAGRTTLKFWAKEGVRAPFAGPPFDAIGIRFVRFYVRDLDEVYAELCARGAHVVAQPRDDGCFGREMSVADPDGSWITFSERR